ncbi:MAG TPA: LysR family transcriptional regulator [Chloroflexota bacterium]|nr:LysR family transcriptional regulator [Chloroflexota bacterium]
MAGRDGEQRDGSAQPRDVALNPVRLAVFCAVVERQSFRRAADELCLAQPTVSGHIRVLEEAFGAPLFDRRRRGAHLTEAGRAVYDYAVGMRRELSALYAHLSDLAGGRAGAVTLGAAQVPGTYILPELLARFYHQHPAARVNLRLVPPDALAEEVLRGRLDFGIVSEITRLGTLQSEPLWAEPTVLIAPAGHRLAGRAAVGLAELAGEAFIVGPARNLSDRALDRGLARAGLPARRVVMEIGTHEGVKQAVQRGVGLAIVFRRVVAAELAQGQLVALPLDELPLVEQFLMVYRRAHRFTPLATSLMAFIRAEAQGFAAAGPASAGSAEAVGDQVATTSRV